MQNLYCVRCSLHKACGKYHIYVIELDPDIRKNKKFMQKNLRYHSGKACLYIGSTSHTPECRFSQHILHIDKENNQYPCLCTGKKVFRTFVRSGGKTRGGYFPGLFGMRLRPDLFFSFNPISTKKKAMKTEETYAKYLRSQGYAVWQN